jgi:hypothetical protein
MLLLLVGTQLPDFVDKPLARWFDVLPHGRTLAHSLLTVTIVGMLVYVYFERRDRSHLGLAFGVGYLSHPLVDSLFPLLNGQYQYVAYLLWPLFGLSELPSYGGWGLWGTNLIEPLELLFGRAEPIDFDVYVSGLLEIVLVVLAGRIWHRDGGLGSLPSGTDSNWCSRRNPIPIDSDGRIFRCRRRPDRCNSAALLA